VNYDQKTCVHVSEQERSYCFAKERDGWTCRAATREELDAHRQVAEKVMAYAVEHYEDGYDWIVECRTLDDIAAEMIEDGHTTFEQVLKIAAIVTDVREDRIADAKNSAF